MTGANWLPISSGEALFTMVCPKEVKEVREDWWLDISDCSIYVYVYLKERMYMYVV